MIPLAGAQALNSPTAAALRAAAPWGGSAAAPAGARLWALEQGGQWHWLAGWSPLAFDSRVFGLALGRLAPLLHRAPWPAAEALAQGRTLLASLAAQAREEGQACLVARLDSRDLLTGQALEAVGGRLVDVGVEWELALAGLPAAAVPAGLELRAWQAGEEEALAELCAASFCDLGAYADRFAMDHRLRGGCPEMYRRWMANSLTGQQADQVLVLAKGKGPVGFITLRRSRAGAPGWVVLNAVHPAWRGHGLYNCLLAAGLTWLAEEGAAWARVRTKVSQQAVIRAWSRLGASQVGAELTFHLWLDED
ncbi:MAG: GNAT family N-acetyltransferase [Thermodesulfobacteriota bacterium]